MASKSSIILFSVISFIVVTGIGLGIYFGLYYEGNDQQRSVVLTISTETSSVNYTMEELKNLQSKTGYGGYKKTTGTIVGPYLYTGVSIKTLLDDIGGISLDENLVVRATDGYEVTYSSTMINGYVTSYHNETGENLGINKFDMIVAYSQNGADLASDDGPLRIVFISDEGYLTDGTIWAKKVQTMEIISDTNDWIVYLYGLTNDSIEKSVFESAMYCGEQDHSAIYEEQDGDRTHTYAGIPLWVIISIIDGELESSTHYTFNDTLVTQGYDVILENSEFTSVSLNSSFIARNNDIILAAKVDSMFLPEEEAPLRLVGNDLQSLQMLGKISSITIILH